MQLFCLNCHCKQVFLFVKQTLNHFSDRPTAVLHNSGMGSQFLLFEFKTLVSAVVSPVPEPAGQTDQGLDEMKIDIWLFLPKFSKYDYLFMDLSGLSGKCCLTDRKKRTRKKSQSQHCKAVQAQHQACVEAALQGGHVFGFIEVHQFDDA
jgi:hypothetical protein